MRNLRKILSLTLFTITAALYSAESSSESASTSSVPQGVESNNADVSTSIEKVKKIKKAKRRIRVEGDFRGKDPMMAPDGQSQLPPTDGSRPKSK